MSQDRKFIHLLYAPTNFCNMSCRYCYLGEGTNEKTDTKKAYETLTSTVDACLEQGIIPFNISFHGGEPTAVPPRLLKDLFAFTKEYYAQYGEKIKEAGFPLNPLHIKTNLYNLDLLYELFLTYDVSISGSVDLPLALHGKYRTDKKGKSTLEKIQHHLKLLANYPHHKKISCVVTREHLQHLDEFVSDIKYIHYDIGLDMTKFNIMFAFDSLKNSEKFTPKIPGTQMLNHEEQVIFYQKLMKEFKGTDLNDGLRNHWFKEFTPEFCCSAINCGDKFFLLQANGDVYACPRGQSSPHFYYGNVKKSRISDIIANGWQTIEALENKKEPCEDCYTCHYLPYCNQSCIFVRQETGLTKSYTCLLQKQIYQDNPERYPPYDEKYVEEYSLRYRFRNNLKSIKKSEHQPTNDRYITPELWDEDNALAQLIKKDPILQKVYDPELFQLIIDDIPYQLKSPILENQSDIALIKPSSQVYLTVDKDVFSLNTKDPVNNTVHLMFLRNTMVTYGDENRLKQEHLVDYSIYEGAFRSFAKVENSEKTMVASKVLYFDLGPFLRLHQDLFLQDIRNNLYVTTKTLREYHYSKQRKNAFYHIQSINLPFPFLEFYW